MNFKNSLLITSLTGIIINPICSNLNSSTTNLTEQKNDIQTIASKYESATIDVSTINFDNFLFDIQNSTINSSLNDSVKTSFPISKTNTTGCFLWYNGEHGDSMASGYNNKIKSDSVTIFDYLSMLAVISDVAHYYGDNDTMNPYIRQAAISKDISILLSFAENLKTKINIDLNYAGLFGNINSWAKNYYQIINDVINKEYSKDPLLYQFNDINFNDLTTYSGNLHFSDDYLSSFPSNASTGSYTVDDYFYLGNSSNNHLFKISFQNNIYFGIRDFIVYHVWDFTFSNPSLYNIELS